jgi:hypothetical protein
MQGLCPIVECFLYFRKKEQLPLGICFSISRSVQITEGLEGRVLHCVALWLHCEALQFNALRILGMPTLTIAAAELDVTWPCDDYRDPISKLQAIPINNTGFTRV